MKIKTNILVSLILALILTYFIATQMRKPKSPLLKTELTDLQNQKFDGILLKNKVFIVSYFQTWCGDCVKAMPKVKEMTKTRRKKESASLPSTSGRVKKSKNTTMKKEKLSSS